MDLEQSLMDLERFCSKAWRQHGGDDPMCQLSFNEFDYLKLIEEHPQGVRITDLAQELYVTKPSASNMVVRLAKKKLVQTITCNQDARVKRVILSDWVRESMSSERVVYQQIATDLNAQLSEQEATQLVQLLNKALKN